MRRHSHRLLPKNAILALTLAAAVSMGAVGPAQARVLDELLLGSILEGSARGVTRMYVGGDLMPFVGTSTFTGGRARRHVSLNLIGGLSGAVQGIGLAGGFNLVRGYSGGVLLAGGFNIVRHGSEGAQLAGGFNWSGLAFRGIQGAGAFNHARGFVQGMQLAGAYNYAGLRVTGAQLAAGFNIARGHLVGLQMSGGFNYSRGVTGIQIAPVNISKGPVSGLQLGLVNVAQRSTLSLGLLNFISDGRTHLSALISECRFMSLNLKHGSDYFHNIYSIGVRPTATGISWSVGLGLGWHIPLPARFFVDIDLVANHVNEGREFTMELNLLSTARAVIGWRPFPGIGIVAGPTLNVFVSKVGDPTRYAPFQSDETGQRDEPVVAAIWPGFVVGLQFF